MNDLVHQHLLRAKDHMKKQSDKNRSERVFQVDDWVFLKAQSYVQSSLSASANQKLAFKFFGPYRVVARIGSVAYKLQLPSSSSVHPVFHVSQLKKCLRVPEEQVPTEVMDLQPDLQYQERPIKILDVATRQTRRTAIRFCRVQWSNHTEADATWEREDDLKKEFPYISKISRNLEDEILFKGGRFCNTQILSL